MLLKNTLNFPLYSGVMKNFGKQNFPQALYAWFLMRNFCAQGPNTIYTNIHLLKFIFFESTEIFQVQEITFFQEPARLNQGSNSARNLSQYLQYADVHVLDYCDSLLQVHPGIRGLVEENPRKSRRDLRSFLPARCREAAGLAGPAACFTEYQHGRFPL